MKKSKIISLIIGGVICIWVLSILPIISHSIEIDLNSGKIREQRYFFSVPVKHEIHESTFSKMIKPYLSESLAPEWQEDCHEVLFPYRSHACGRMISACNSFCMSIKLIESSKLLNSKEKEEYILKCICYMKNSDEEGIEALNSLLMKIYADCHTNASGTDPKD